MKRYITIIVILFFCIVDAWSQNPYYIETLYKIISGSTTDKSLKAGFMSDSLGYRRGLNPADPRFEIDYFFENRFEANLTVDLDMPSLYHQRNVLSKLNIGHSKDVYRKNRQEILTEISDYYMELIYNVKLNELLGNIFRLDSINYHRQNIKEALENGDINALDYADLQVTFSMVADAIMETQKQIEILTGRIHMYNPGFVLTEKAFPHFEFNGMTSEEFVENVISHNPVSDMMEKDSLIYQRQLKLAKWEWAPKIVIGTRLDMDEKRNFAPAAIAGLSIPLWENRGNIRHAKAQITSGAVENEKKELEFRTDLEQLYKQYATAKEMIHNWEGYDIEYHCKKLTTAYNAGILTASDLYFEFSHILDNATRILQLQLEQASCAARMTIMLNGDDI